MARQKTVQEPKKKKARNIVTDAPKRSKQKRSKNQIERVKKDGARIAAIVDNDTYI